MWETNFASKLGKLSDNKVFNKISRVLVLEYLQIKEAENVSRGFFLSLNS